MPTGRSSSKKPGGLLPEAAAGSEAADGGASLLSPQQQELSPTTIEWTRVTRDGEPMLKADCKRIWFGANSETVMTGRYPTQLPATLAKADTLYVCPACLEFFLTREELLSLFG